MSKLKKALQYLKKENLTVEESINKTIYDYEGDLIAFFDWDGEEEYKGMIIFSEDEEKIGEVHWWFIDNSMKPFYVLEDNA